MLDRKKVYEQLRAVLVNTIEVTAVLLKDACVLGMDLRGEIVRFEEARRLSNMFIRTGVEGVDPSRFNHILKETSEFYYSLRDRVAKLLRCPSFVLWMEGRIEAAAPTLSDEDARALRIELRSYTSMVKDNESFAVLRAAMAAFNKRLSGLEADAIRASVDATLAGAPARSKKGGKTRRYVSKGQSRDCTGKKGDDSNKRRTGKQKGSSKGKQVNA